MNIDRFQEKVDHALVPHHGARVRPGDRGDVQRGPAAGGAQPARAKAVSLLHTHGENIFFLIPRQMI